MDMDKLVAGMMTFIVLVFITYVTVCAVAAFLTAPLITLGSVAALTYIAPKIYRVIEKADL